jgi:DNA polymerase-1
MSTLLLIDGHAFAYRAFYAIRNLNAPDGQPTNAIYGFISMVSRMRQRTQPTHLAVVWDGGLDEKRVGALPAYKAQRPEMPEELSQQIEAIHEYERAAGLGSIVREGMEADDLIAGLARRALEQGMSVVVASPDKDFFQLVSDRLRLLNPADKTGALWGDAEVLAKTGVRPAQIVDWLSLLGDVVDNIGGVPGVGPKTAARLLQEFGSVDEIYRQLDRVSSEKLRSALAAAESVVRRNQGVVRLREDLDVGVTVASLVPAAADAPALGALFSRWGFRSFFAELKLASAGQTDLFAAP